MHANILRVSAPPREVFLAADTAAIQRVRGLSTFYDFWKLPPQSVLQLITLRTSRTLREVSYAGETPANRAHRRFLAGHWTRRRQAAALPVASALPRCRACAPTVYYLLPTAYCLLPIAYCLLSIAYCLLYGITSVCSSIFFRYASMA